MSGQTVRQRDVKDYGIDPYTVPCPLCDAKVGEVCELEAGKRNASPHNVRLIAARAELEAGKAVTP